MQVKTLSRPSTTRTFALAFLGWFIVILAVCILGGCGGGGSSNDDNTLVSKPQVTVSLFGTSGMAAKSSKTALLDRLSPISSAVADSAAATGTQQAIQDGLTAAGVSASVSIGDLDGLTLHDYVAQNYPSGPPTQAQLYAAWRANPFPTDLVLYNFNMADLRGAMSLPDDASKIAAVNVFLSDLNTFLAWKRVEGKQTAYLGPDPSSDADVQTFYNSFVANNLSSAIQSGYNGTSAVPSTLVAANGYYWPLYGYVMASIADWQSHVSGSDANTPDDWLSQQHVPYIVQQIQNWSANQLSCPAGTVLNLDVGCVTPDYTGAAPASDASAASEVTSN